MKIFLIVSGCIVILITFFSIIRFWIRRGKVYIRSVLTCKPLIINPDLKDSVVYLRKGGYIKVREGLEMMKISNETLRDKNLRFYETFNPEYPERRKLILVRILDKYTYNAITLSKGARVVYYEGSQPYVASSNYEGTISAFSGAASFSTTNGDTHIKFSDIFGHVEKIYGDYEIRESSGSRDKKIS